MKTKKIYTLEKEKLDSLMNKIISCSKFAIEKQNKIIRNYKKDGSILTEVDLEISRRICKYVKENFPQCNIISEEENTTFDLEAPYTFVLDPIDGTDVYSNGLPCFAISLGILDINRNPVGAMIVAPRFGFAENKMELRLDPGKTLYINGKEFTPNTNHMDNIKQITISSKSQKTINFDNYKGKVRTFGSSIIHLLCPVIFPFIDGCINQRAYIWDICASHAVLNYANLQVTYSNKKPLIYTDKMIIERKVSDFTIYCGTKKGIEDMFNKLTLKEGKK